jgi:hypothetical protein
LALALLLEITTEEMALLWYQTVQSHIVAKLAQDDFVIDSQEIVDCIVNEVKAEFMSEAQSPEADPRWMRARRGSPWRQPPSR